MNNKGSNRNDLFSSLIEGFIEIIQTVTEPIIQKAMSAFKEWISVKFNFQDKTQISMKMLDDKTQATGVHELGWSVNHAASYKFRYLQPHLHTFIIGASGWGKSNLINLLMEDNLRKNKAVIFIDPKGTLAAIEEFQKLCSHYKRKFHIFSEHHGVIEKFNPLESMNADQALIMIMRSFDWGSNPNQYYLKCAESALKSVLDKLYREKKIFGLRDIYVELSQNHNYPENKGLLTQFQLLVNSVYGHLFEVSEGKESINFKKAWERGECIYIGASTMGYGSMAKTIGKLFVSELETLAHYIGTIHKTQEEAIKKSIGVFIDEAGSILFPDFIDLANKARSSGINLTVAVQSYSDMEMISKSSTLMEQLMECFSTWFVQRQLHPANAEILASIFGTRLANKKTTMTEGGAESSKGSLREGHEFIFNPNFIKSIRIGQAILLTLNPNDTHFLNLRNANFLMRFAEKEKKDSREKVKKEEVLSIPLGGQNDS